MVAVLAAGQRSDIAETGSMQNTFTSQDSSQGTITINGDEGASSSTASVSAATVTTTTSAVKGSGLHRAESGFGLLRVAKGGGVSMDVSSSLGPLPEVGVATTCHACKERRVSRTVICRSCGSTFHWSCIGFYEHLYRRPKEDWRCKGCATVKGGKESGAGRGKVEEENDKETNGEEVAQASQSQESEHGEPIDVGVEAPPVTAPLEVSPSGAASSTRGSGQEVQVGGVKEAPASALGAGEARVVDAIASSSVANAPSITTAASTGDRVCPVCKKDIGRKRTMDCSVCRKPSHAGCVNVRGAETPISWVCRDCLPQGAGNGELDVQKAMAPATSPGGSAQTAEGKVISTPEGKFSDQPDLLAQLLHGRSPRQMRAASPAASEKMGYMGRYSCEGEALVTEGTSASKQERALLVPCPTGTDETVVAVDDVRLNKSSVSSGVGGNAGGQGWKTGIPEKDRGWDSDMDLTVDDKQQECASVRTTRRKRSTKRKSLVIPPPPSSPPRPHPGPLPSLPSSEVLPSTPSTKVSETTEGAKTTSACSLSDDVSIAPAPASASVSPQSPPLPNPEAHETERDEVNGKQRSSEAQPPLHTSTPSLPIPLPPSPPLPPLPPLPPAAPRYASAVEGMSDPRSLELIPLGRVDFGSKATSSAGVAAAGQLNGAKGTSSRVIETGKKSYLFSEKEQKAMAGGVRAPHQVLGGKTRAGVQLVSAKLKGKKPGTDSRPRVASVFTTEAQVSAKKMYLAKAHGGLDKKRLPPLSEPCEAENTFNLQKVIASIAKREVKTSTVDSCGLDSSSDARSRADESGGSRTPRGLKQLTRWVTRPTGDAAARSSKLGATKLGATVEPTKMAPKSAVIGPSKSGRGTPGNVRRGLNGKTGKSRRRYSSSSDSSSSSSESSSSKSSPSTSTSRSRSYSSSRGRSRSRSSRRGSSRNSRGDSRRRSMSRSASSNRVRSFSRGDSENSNGRVGYRRQVYRTDRGVSNSGERIRHGYEGSSGRDERGRSNDRRHEFSRGGAGYTSKSSGRSRSRDARDSRERNFSSRGSGRGNQDRRKNEQAMGKRSEPSKSWNGDGGTSTGERAQKRRSSSMSRSWSRGRASTARDQTRRGGSREDRASDTSCGARDRRRGSGRGGGDGSPSTERSGSARDIDERVLRARRDKSRYPNTHPSPSRPDQRQSVESSPGFVSSSFKPPSCGSARRAPTPGKVSSGGGSDGSAAHNRGSEIRDDPVPLAGSALSSAYDRLPMPTSSLEYNPSMGGDDLFSSLEDQFADPVMRSTATALSPGRPSRSSSIGSPSSATTGTIPSSVAVAVAPVATTSTPSPVCPSVAALTDTAATTSVAQGGETTKAHGKRVVVSNTSDGGEEKSEPEDDAVTSEHKLSAALVVASATPKSTSTSTSTAVSTLSTVAEVPKASTVTATLLLQSAPTALQPSTAVDTLQEGTGGVAQGVVAGQTSSRSTPVTHPPPSSPLMPQPVVLEPPASCSTLANTVKAKEALGEGRDVGGATTRAHHLEESGTPAADKNVLSPMTDGGSGGGGHSLGHDDGLARTMSELPYKGCAAAAAGGKAPRSDADVDPGMLPGVTKDNAKQSCKSGREADDADEEEVDVEGGAEDQGEKENREEGRKNIEESRDEDKDGDQGRHKKGKEKNGEEDKEEHEEEEKEQGVPPEEVGCTSTGAAASQSKKPNPWYRNGTMVVLNCGPKDKPGRPRPWVAIVDLLGRPARVLEQPRVFKGPRFHTVEFQPWEGGPSTAVEMKVRATLLRPAPSNTSDGKSCTLRGGAAGAHEDLPAALVITRRTARTRKAMKDMKQKNSSASVEAEGSATDGEGGSSAGSEESDGVGFGHGGDSSEDQEDSDGGKEDVVLDEEEEAGGGKGENGGKAETVHAGKRGKPVKNSKHPPYFPVGARVMLTKKFTGKHSPRGPHIDPVELVGKAAIVTRSGTYLCGPKFHCLSFEPWRGGPVETITWTVPRHCLALCPTTDHLQNAGDDTAATGAAPVSASASSSSQVEISTASVAAALGNGPTKGMSDGAKKAEVEKTRENQSQAVGEIEAGGDSEVRSRPTLISMSRSPPLPSTGAVYPVGTAVVVPSLEIDPGRTLKFAHGETHEAAFRELVGREGKVIGSPPPSRKGFRYHLIEYQPWEGGPAKPFTWNVKMAALVVLRLPPSQPPPPSIPEKDKGNGDASDSGAAAGMEGMTAADPCEEGRTDNSSAMKRSGEARGEMTSQRCSSASASKQSRDGDFSRLCLEAERKSSGSTEQVLEKVVGAATGTMMEHVSSPPPIARGLEGVVTSANVPASVCARFVDEGSREESGAGEGEVEISSPRKKGGEAHKDPPVRSPPPPPLARKDREIIPLRAGPDHECAFLQSGSRGAKLSDTTTKESMGELVAADAKDGDLQEETGRQVAAAASFAAMTASKSLEVERVRQRSPNGVSQTPAGVIRKRLSHRPSPPHSSPTESEGVSDLNVQAVGLGSSAAETVAGTPSARDARAEHASGTEGTVEKDWEERVARVAVTKSAREPKAEKANRVVREPRAAKAKTGKEAKVKEVRAEKNDDVAGKEARVEEVRAEEDAAVAAATDSATKTKAKKANRAGKGSRISKAKTGRPARDEESLVEEDDAVTSAAEGATTTETTAKKANRAGKRSRISKVKTGRPARDEESLVEEDDAVTSAAEGATATETTAKKANRAVRGPRTAKAKAGKDARVKEARAEKNADVAANEGGVENARAEEDAAVTGATEADRETKVEKANRAERGAKIAKANAGRAARVEEARAEEDAAVVTAVETEPETGENTETEAEGTAGDADAGVAGVKFAATPNGRLVERGATAGVAVDEGQRPERTVLIQSQRRRAREEKGGEDGEEKTEEEEKETTHGAADVPLSGDTSRRKGKGATAAVAERKPRKRKRDRSRPTASTDEGPEEKTTDVINHDIDKEKRKTKPTNAAIWTNSDDPRPTSGDSGGVEKGTDAIRGEESVPGQTEPHVGEAITSSAEDVDGANDGETTPSGMPPAEEGSSGGGGIAEANVASVVAATTSPTMGSQVREKPETVRAGEGGDKSAQGTHTAVMAAETGAGDVQRLMTMVRGLQEEMQGLKSELKRRRSSSGGGGERHPSGRRASRSRRGPSSSPSGADSDHESRSDEWSSSGDKGAGRESRKFEDSRRNNAPAVMGAVHQGSYFPYHPPPPGAYPYMPTPLGCYYYGGPPPYGGAAAYPTQFPGTAYGRPGKSEELGGAREEQRGRSEKRQRRGGSELSHRDYHRRSWGGEVKGESASTHGIRGGSGDVHHADNSSGGGAVAIATSKRGVESAATDSGGDCVDERVRSDGEESAAARGRRRGQERGKHEGSAGDDIELELVRGAASGSLAGAGSREGKRRRRSHNDAVNYSYPRDADYDAVGGDFPPAGGFVYPSPIGVTGRVGDHMLASAPPARTGGGGYVHASSYQIPPDPRAVFHHGHFSDVPGWSGHPYPPATTVHSHPGRPSYQGGHSSRRRHTRPRVPEDAGVDRGTPRVDGGRRGADHGGSSSRRDLDRRSESDGYGWESEER